MSIWHLASEEIAPGLQRVWPLRRTRLRARRWPHWTGTAYKALGTIAMQQLVRSHDATLWNWLRELWHGGRPNHGGMKARRVVTFARRPKLCLRRTRELAKTLSVHCARALLVETRSLLRDALLGKAFVREGLRTYILAPI